MGLKETFHETLENAVSKFVSRFESLVTGVLSGFDRLVFRGTLLPLMMRRGMHTHLFENEIRLLDYKDYALATSEKVKAAALAETRAAGRPALYLRSSRDSKEELARSILAEQPTEQGPICALTAVEPCQSFEYLRSKDTTERGLRLAPRKCLHVYQYRIHPRFGFMNARLQTWFPFSIQICMNGREWLSRQLTEAGIGFRRYDNCFPHIDDIPRAQQLLDDQLKTAWPEALDEIARLLNPRHGEIFTANPMDYYWSAYQTEWATDVMFRDPEALASLYPALVRHAMHHFQSPDVMRFLGRKLHPNFQGEVTTSYKHRLEGARVKHWANGNSVKMYDKGGNILRVETTMARFSDFKVMRPPHDDPDGKLDWRPMRKGVADLHRGAEIAQRSNERYLDALSVVDDTTPLGDIFDQVNQPVTWKDKRVRALRVGDHEDLALLAVISRGEFTTAGFRNRDLRALLRPDSLDATPAEVRKVSARIGRLLRMLRAHGLIQKIPKTHRYKLTAKGVQLAAAIAAARGANLKLLLREAA